MRVLVAAVAQPSGISGVQRHALNLVLCLLQCSEITAVHLALAPWQLHLPALAGLQQSDRLQIEVAMVKRGSIARNAWYLRELPKLARKVRADLTQLSYPVPSRRSFMPCPTVMTLHDLYPFQIPRNFGFPQVVVNQLILYFALRQADAISCVSNTTLRALRQSKLGTASLCTVIPNCVQPGPPSSPCSPLRGWKGEPFLLAVAQHRRNKNLALLLRSFGRLLASGQLPRTARLVLIGMNGPETRKLHTLAWKLDIASRADFLEGLSDAELQWCYRHCTALVAPSSIEGFGLPVVEARLAGCRVVCSDIPAFRELSGPNVSFFDLRQGAEHSLSMAIADAIVRPRPTPEPLPELALDTIAAAYLELYRMTLARQADTVGLSCTTGHFKERQIL